MTEHDELLEDLERCADDGHPIVGKTLRCTCGHVDWTTPEVQVLSDAMSRHSMTGYWEEKAWEVLQDLAANGWRLVAGSATRPEPLWTALVEDVWRDDDDRVVARLRRTDEGNGTLPTGRSVEVHAAVAGSATPTTTTPQGHTAVIRAPTLPRNTLNAVAGSATPTEEHQPVGSGPSGVWCAVCRLPWPCPAAAGSATPTQEDDDD
jgi:hypothetical protein